VTLLLVLVIVLLVPFVMSAFLLPVCRVPQSE
jgi:hypothetical protein